MKDNTPQDPFASKLRMANEQLQGWKHCEHELQPLKTALQKEPGRLISFLSDNVFRLRGSSP
jgi:hypothetical protein